MIRVTGTFITLAILLAQKTSLRLRNERTSAQLYSMGLFDTSAFALSNLGMRIEQVAIVSVLGSLYGAVTVVLSAIFSPRTHRRSPGARHRFDLFRSHPDVPLSRPASSSPMPSALKSARCLH
jgi:hypothetical protein